MFTLIKDNVERIVLDECVRAALIKDGFEVVKVNNDYKLLTVEQLKVMATEKGIDFDNKSKKAELIALIENVEDGE